jgi:mono/diheme cytochrome c family protein
LVFAGLGAAWADEATIERGRELFDGKAGCSFCHGWAANGQGDPRSEGGGLSLRETPLDRAAIRETIQCGRPGTAMPHFDRFAYTDDRCFGLTAEDLGDDVPTRAFNTLQAHETDAIADYLEAKVVGAGPVTFEWCVEFFGAVVDECGKYPAEDGSAPDMTGADPTPSSGAAGDSH